jgi:transcriptional regulator with XRE-family HTH domain
MEPSTLNAVVTALIIALGIVVGLRWGLSALTITINARWKFPFADTNLLQPKAELEASKATAEPKPKARPKAKPKAKAEVKAEVKEKPIPLGEPRTCELCKNDFPNGRAYGGHLGACRKRFARKAELEAAKAKAAAEEVIKAKAEAEAEPEPEKAKAKRKLRRGDTAVYLDRETTKHYRSERDLTVAATAELIDISPSHYGHVEAGRRALPLATAQRLAGILGANVSEIVHTERPKLPPKRELVYVDGEMMRLAREEMAMGAGDLARRTGVSEAWINLLESGEYPRTNSVILTRIAETLGVDPAMLRISKPSANTAGV